MNRADQGKDLANLIGAVRCRKSELECEKIHLSVKMKKNPFPTVSLSFTAFSTPPLPNGSDIALPQSTLSQYLQHLLYTQLTELPWKWTAGFSELLVHIHHTTWHNFSKTVILIVSAVRPLNLIAFIFQNMEHSIFYFHYVKWTTTKNFNYSK